MMVWMRVMEVEKVTSRKSWIREVSQQDVLWSCGKWDMKERFLKA